MIKQALKEAYAALPFKQQLFRLIRPLRPPQRLYRHLHFHGVITVPVPGHGSFRMRHRGYLIENELFWRGLAGWEPVSTDLWTRLCEGASTIIDVGANTGVYTLLARTVDHRATIVALEPMASVFRMLEDNLRLNGHTAMALQAAASDHDGTAPIYAPPDEHVLSVSLNRTFNTFDPAVRPVPVTVRTLDRIVEELGRPPVDLIKIDTETHEPEVVQGALAVLRRDRPSLLIEILNDEVGRRVEALLDGLGYRYFNIDEHHGVRPVEHLVRRGPYNFLVCRPEVAARLGLG